MQKITRHPSIMQKKKECYIRHTTYPLHLHHIYPGNGRRRICDLYGFWCWLSPELHNVGINALHNGNTSLDMFLRCQCQREFERYHSREEFIRIIGGSYLDRQHRFDS